MRIFGCLVIFYCLSNILSAQVERIYDEEGNLRTVKPINAAGLYDGLAVSYYPNGVIEQELPYEDGAIHGVMRGYYPDGELRQELRYHAGLRQGAERTYHPNGSLEMERHWEADRLHGRMSIRDTLHRLRMIVWMEADSVVFAQRFAADGRLTHEKVGRWGNFRLDTSELLSIRVYAEAGLPLRAGRWQGLQVLVPGVPTHLMRLNCEGCQDFETGQSLPYPLQVMPADDRSSLTFYLRVSLRPGAAPVMMRSISLPIASP
jgi:hypothetical protein